MKSSRVLDKFILCFYNMECLIKKIVQKQDKNRFKDEIEYFELLNQEYNEVKSFKHDYNNILSTISTYIQEKDIVGLEKYFYEKIVKVDNSQMGKLLYIGSLSNLKINEIRGMILSKIILAERRGVSMKISIPEEINEIWGTDTIILSRCLGIIIDNAIEASELCEEPTINVVFVKSNNEIKCIIENKYKEESIDMNKIYEKGSSSKGTGRGLGLYIVRSLLSYEENIFINSIMKDNFFIQELNIIKDKYATDKSLKGICSN